MVNQERIRKSKTFELQKPTTKKEKKMDWFPATFLVWSKGFCLWYLDSERNMEENYNAYCTHL